MVLYYLLQSKNQTKNNNFIISFIFRRCFKSILVHGGLKYIVWMCKLQYRRQPLKLVPAAGSRVGAMVRGTFLLPCRSWYCHLNGRKLGRVYFATSQAHRILWLQSTCYQMVANGQCNRRFVYMKAKISTCYIYCCSEFRLVLSSLPLNSQLLVDSGKAL